MYDFIILFTAGAAILSSLSPKLDKYGFYFISFSMSLVSAFRGILVDRDSLVYVSVYNQLEMISSFHELIRFSFAMGQEIGFISWMKLFSIIGADFFLFRLFYNLVCLFFLIYLIKKLSLDKFRVLSYLTYVALFYLYRDFTQIRFCLSALIAVMAMIKKYENKKIQSSIFIIFAILIHNAALIMLPVILICNKNYAYSLKFLILCFSISFLILLLDPFGHIVSMGIMPHQITRYSGELQENTLGVNFFISSFLSLILCACYKENYSLDYKILCLTMLFSSCISVAFYGVPILMRMQLLCFTSLIIAPSVIYKYFLKKNFFTLIIFQYTLLILLVLYFYKNLSSEIVYEYYFYWG